MILPSSVVSVFISSFSSLISCFDILTWFWHFHVFQAWTFHRFKTLISLAFISFISAFCHFFPSIKYGFSFLFPSSLKSINRLSTWVILFFSVGHIVVFHKYLYVVFVFWFAPGCGSRVPVVTGVYALCCQLRSLCPAGFLSFLAEVWYSPLDCHLKMNFFFPCFFWFFFVEEESNVRQL